MRSSSRPDPNSDSTFLTAGGGPAGLAGAPPSGPPGPPMVKEPRRVVDMSSRADSKQRRTGMEAVRAVSQAT